MAESPALAARSFGSDRKAGRGHSRPHAAQAGLGGQLHEIGSHISHSDYHKHGAYILDNADALGFSLPELHRLSLLVLGHRGKLRKLERTLSDECSSPTAVPAPGGYFVPCPARSRSGRHDTTRPAGANRSA